MITKRYYNEEIANVGVNVDGIGQGPKGEPPKKKSRKKKVKTYQEFIKEGKEKSADEEFISRLDLKKASKILMPL